MERKTTPLMELPLKNDFMFGQVMRTPEICKLFLEELLGKEIDHIEYVDTQKELNDSYLHHGIRIDVYLRDEDRTVYAIEMQNALKADLEKRVRYYQGTMDRTELLKGRSYGELSESFIIFICDFDYFETGLAVNERVSYLKGTDKEYEDGSHVIFLNSRYKTGNAGLAITEYLDYIRTNDDSRVYTTELVHKTVEKVQEVRSDDKMEVSYMMWQLKFQDAREEGRAEGHAEGMTDGALKVIRGLMKNMGLSAEQALATADIPEAERPRYEALLRQNP